MKRWLRETRIFRHGRGVGTVMNVNTGEVSIAIDKHGKANCVSPFLGLKIKLECTPSVFTRGNQ
jgi:hypothetical protein